jgi:Domain of unknown function (DUF4402)
MRAWVFAASAAMALMGSSLVTSANAQVVATIEAQAKLIAPLKIETTQNLNFGTIAPEQGKVAIISVDPEGGGEASNATQVGAFTPAEFTITGEPNTSLSIQTTSSAGEPISVFDIVGPGGARLVVSAITNTIGARPDGVGRYTLSLTSGSLRVGVGGTLTIPPSSPTGVYRGTFQIAAIYN